MHDKKIILLPVAALRSVNIRYIYLQDNYTCMPLGAA